MAVGICALVEVIFVLAGRNSVIDYRLLSLSDHLMLDSTIGQLSVVKAFDRELRDTYELSVTATEKGRNCVLIKTKCEQMLKADVALRAMHAFASSTTTMRVLCSLTRYIHWMSRKVRLLALC